MTVPVHSRRVVESGTPADGLLALQRGGDPPQTGPGASHLSELSLATPNLQHRMPNTKQQHVPSTEMHIWCFTDSSRATVGRVLGGARRGCDRFLFLQLILKCQHDMLLQCPLLQ